MRIRIFVFCLIASFILVFNQAEAVEIKQVSLWTADACYAITSNENYLFVGSNDKIYIFKFIDPRLQLVAKCQINFIVNKLFVVGDYLYVADAYVGLLIIDISEITKPKIINYYCAPGVSRDIWANNQYVYLAVDKYGVNIIDVSNPKQLKEVSRIPTNDKTWALTVSGDYLFAANYLDDLQIFNISNPIYPKQIISVSLDGMGLGLYLNWPYLYCAIGDSGMQIIDISNPEKPKLLGRCPRSYSADYIFAWGIKVIGKYAFVTDMAGLQIIDVSNIQKPKQVSYYSTMHDGVAVAIEVRPTQNPQEFLVYVGLGGSGLKVFRVKI